ncbi:MAG: ABC transporter permease [Gemmatimonadota bacterium]|nr:ABC transporter permease [Gemmatimonadota bacterium]
MLRDSILRRYRRFFGADPRRDVDDELAFHVAMRVEEFMRAGMTRDEAQEAAMKRFGSLSSVREECHELGRRSAARQRRAIWLAALRQDVRFALRTIAANRGFATMVVLTLALGIGATTAVFSVAYGVLLRPLPYRDADSLVRLWSRRADRGLDFFSISPADYASWRERNRVFTAMAALERQRDATLRRGSEPQAVEVAAVTPDVFPLLGAAALRGRVLLPDDARPGAPPVAVIDHGLWTARFGADPSVVGSDVTIDGHRHTVVGVMPPRFWIPATTAVIWTPLSLANAMADRANRHLRVLARLAPGVPFERARSEMDAIAATLARDHPETNAAWSINMMSITEWIVGTQFRRAVLALLGVVGFVLLIACANSANLQLARGAARRREIAVRAALGATRARITTQLLTESVLLGAIAGVLGVALAHAGLELLRAVGTETVPRLDDVRLDGPVLAFTAAVALGSGVLFGLLPALRASRSDVGEVLKAGGRGAGQGLAGKGVRAALVVAEISLSLILLVGAGLLMRSFMRLQAVDLGFTSTNVAAVRLRLPEASYPDPDRTGAFYTALVERVRQIPGVAEAAGVSSAPFGGPNTGNVFAREDRPPAGRDQAPDADYRVITPGYLRALGIRLLRGRDVSPLDRKGAPEVVLISEGMARRYWPGEDPLGRRIRVGDIVDGPPLTIVGVVGDVRYQSRESPDVRPMIYFSALARPPRSMTVLIRTTGSDAPVAAIRSAVASLDPSLPPATISSMEELMRPELATPRFAFVLFAIFAGAALVLAAVGVYGVMSYLVRQQTHEFGVRSALGASAGTLVRSVVGGAMRLTIAGVALGLVGALLLTRSISPLLFEVSATDPRTFVSIALLLTAIGVVASALPARRAARADPLVALRGGS